MKDNHQAVNQIKDKVSIVDVISSYLSLSKKGNNYIGVCPFHSDKHPSLSVNEQKKIFKCFACNVSGDVFSFVSKIEHIGYYDAIFKVAEKFNININDFKYLKSAYEKNQEFDVLYQVNSKACEYFGNFLFNEENKHAIEYLNQRQIDKEIIQHFKIGFAPHDNKIMIDLLANHDNMLGNADLGFKLKDIATVGLSFIDKIGDSRCIFTDRVMFPIYNLDNKVVGFGGRTVVGDENKYLNTATTPIFNKSEILFNLNNILLDNADTEEVYLVEGYMDVIALHKIGIKNAVATMGVAFSEKHLETISILSNLKIINICYDNDDAGKTAANKTASLIQKKYLVSLLDYQTTYKDIDEIVNADKELAKEEMKHLVDFTSYKINQLFRTTDLTSPNARRIIFEQAITILNNEKDVVSLNDNIAKLSEQLNIDKEMIIQKLKPSKSSLSKRVKDFSANYSVEFEKEIKPTKKPSSNSVTSAAEKEILLCLFLSRDCVGIFEEKCNVFLENDNNEIFNIIQDYYFSNPDVNSIDPDNIKDIFKDNEELIPKVMEIALKKEKVSLKNIQERLVKTIDRQMQLIRKEGHKKIVEKMKHCDPELQQELLKKVFGKK